MRRLLSSLIILPVLIGPVLLAGLAYASPELSDVQHKLQEVQQEKKASQQKVSDSKNKINEIEKETQVSNGKINDLQSHIGDVNDQMQALQASIQQETADLTQTAQNLQDADLRVQQRDQMLANKLRMLYVNGNVSFLDVLLNSTSFMDFISRWQSMEALIGFDKAMLESNKKDKQLIAEKETQLQQQLAEVNRNYETLQQQNKQLLAQKVKEEVTIASYSRKEQDLKDATQSAMDNLQELASREKALLEQEKELKALAESSSVLTSHASLQKVIHPLLGIRYVWGGTTLQGFDCSGFSQYVLAQYGVHLPRTSAEQSHAGDYVSKKDLRTGDLVFFNTYGSPGTVTHVAIYIGNGEIVNAVGTAVQINRLDDRYFASRFLSARRVLTDKQYKAMIQ